MAALAFTVLTTTVLLQSSTRPLIGPAMPSSPPDLGRELFLTAGHIGVFVGTVALWTWALMTRLPLRRAVYITVCAAFLYSLLTEWGQSFVPDRSASLYDIGVNGAATLITAWLIIRHHDAH